MFTVYFDESGTHNKSGALAVAGYIALDRQWIEFEREWRELLNAENITMFHRTDSECFLNEFSQQRGWNPVRRARVVMRAQGIIRRRVNIGIAVGVIKSDYDEILTDDARERYGKNYYSFAINNCLEEVANWIKKYRRREPINYVFEAGAEGRGEVEERFVDISKDEELRELYNFNGWSFADKREVVQLQAADLIAYETYKQLDNRIVAGVKRDMRRSLVDLLRASGGTPHHSNYWCKENLIELMEHYRETEKG